MREEEEEGLEEVEIGGEMTAERGTASKLIGLRLRLRLNVNYQLVPAVMK